MKRENYFINRQKGILIVFEGISGCGKSEGVRNLYQYLLSRGFKTKVIEWNSNKIIRKIVDRLHSMNLLTSWIYSILQWISFLLDYYLKIKPSLEDDYILIADRYIYTGQIRDIANGAKNKWGERISKLVRKPDLVLLYDIDVQVCYERIEKRGKILFHPNKRKSSETLTDENLKYLQVMQDQYIKLSKDPELIKETNIINILLQSIEASRTTIRKYVDQYISLKSENGYFNDDNVNSVIAK